jgi:hypothetical protein
VRKLARLILLPAARERYGYEVGLSNNMDLKFSSAGEFIGIDD